MTKHETGLGPISNAKTDMNKNNQQYQPVIKQEKWQQITSTPV